jgi:hypothetical protein
MTATDTATDTQAPAPTETKPAPKTKRFFSVGLHGADGSTMRVTAALRKDGSATTYATHTVQGAGGKRQSKRGATERHEDMAHARTAVEKLAASAVKLGWQRRASGFKARPDAFDAAHLPAPGAQAKASKK